MKKMEFFDAAHIAEIREKASRIPVGVAGECIHCEEHSLRLVGGACAPCRDRLGLP
jgi:hypothetical protein